MNIPLSNRTFGIELEFGQTNSDALDEVELDIFRPVSDASITCPNGFELVSPPLRGVDDLEMALANVQQLVDHNEEHDDDLSFILDDPSCGFHVHLDGTEFIGRGGNESVRPSELKGRDPMDLGSNVVFASWEAIRGLLHLSKGTRLDFSHYQMFYDQVKGVVENLSATALQNPSGEEFSVLTQIEGGHLVAYVEEGKPTHLFVLTSSRIRSARKKFKQGEGAVPFRKILKDDIKSNTRGRYFFEEEDREAAVRLKTVFVFYVLFDEMISGMVPNSRKFGNMYCGRVSDNYRISDILSLTRLRDLKAYWYGESVNSGAENNHYHGSRYQNVNLHSLWNRHGTVEIRSHKTTTDPKKIALWIWFHQSIVDMCASGEINVERLLPASKLDLENQTRFFLENVPMDDRLKEYVRTTVNHYNYLEI